MTAAAVSTSAAYCCQLTKRSKSQFYLTFFALPRAMFRDMCVLYAFMRTTDDIADDQSVPVDDRAARLANWGIQLTRAIAQEQVEHPVLPAVVELIERQRIPSELLFDVIEGVASDLKPQVFTTFADLDRYCYRVAGAVGLCCISIWKFTDWRAHGAAKHCGTAFQLTNILRDLAEDWRNGRCYLPREDLHRFGVSPEMLARGGSDPGYQALMKFQADRARSYFELAQPLLEWLSPEGRRVQRAMFGMYGGLLDEIERRKFDVQSERVRVPRRVKWRVAARCFWPG